MRSTHVFRPSSASAFFVVVIALSIAPSAAAQAVKGTAATGDGWSFQFTEGSPGVYKAKVIGIFDGGAPQKALSDAVIKPTGAQGVPGKNSAQAIVLGPDVAFAESDVSFTGDFQFPARYVYSYSITPIAEAATPTPQVPKRTTTAIASMIDPMALKIGNVGASLSFEESLAADTHLAPFVSDEGPFPVVLQGRFGAGSITDPVQFWPDNGLPAGATFDLFRIEVFENSAGHVQASVQLFSSPSVDFGLSFVETAAQIESAIETASWQKNAAGEFTLGGDVSLLHGAITNLDPSVIGAAASFGTTMEATAFDQKLVPEPATYVLFLFGSLMVAACVRRQKRR